MNVGELAGQPRRFLLRESGQTVAQGVRFRDGTVALRDEADEVTATFPSTDALMHSRTWADATVFLTLSDAFDSSAYPTRLWHLHRDEDLSGMSGTGVVAEGVQWPDGQVAYRWTTDPSTTQLASSVEDVEHIHGHGGKTRVVWHDE